MTIAVILTGCFSTAIYPGAEKPLAQIVTLKGFFKDYLIYSEQIEIFSVDGKRPQDGSASEVRFLPGKHWASTLETRYAWSTAKSFCAFEVDFLPGHTYQLKSFSTSPDVRWFEALPSPYKGSIQLDVSAPDLASYTLQMDTECSNRDWLCRQAQDCGKDTSYACRTEPGFKQGVCHTPNQ